MKVRVTNNSEIDPASIEKVERTETGYHVRFTNGATQYRTVQLTTEGRALLEARLHA